MNTQFTAYSGPDRSFIQANPGATSRGGAQTPRGTTAKRGRKPKATDGTSATNSPRPTSIALPASSSQSTDLQWHGTPSVGTPGASTFPVAGSSSAGPSTQQALQPTDATIISLPGAVEATVIAPAGDVKAAIPVGTVPPGAAPAGEEDGEGEDELLPAMADDDYTAQLSFQSQSKDNLKVLMDNFSPEQYERFEAYRRHALPKAAIRSVLKQHLQGTTVSQPVAQIVAGFAKVFVGEMVEKARTVQERRGETGPLSPDHLREAYRMYQQETGRVGAARPLRGKRLFTR